MIHVKRSVKFYKTETDNIPPRYAIVLCKKGAIQFIFKDLHLIY